MLYLESDYYILELVEILESARRHGLSDSDIRHAWVHAVGFIDVEAHHDPPKTLCVGPDRAGNLLEMLYLQLRHDDVIIHAMPLRRTFERYLTRGRP